MIIIDSFKLFNNNSYSLLYSNLIAIYYKNSVIIVFLFLNRINIKKNPKSIHAIILIIVLLLPNPDVLTSYIFEFPILMPIIVNIK